MCSGLFFSKNFFHSNGRIQLPSLPLAFIAATGAIFYLLYGLKKNTRNAFIALVLTALSIYIYLLTLSPVVKEARPEIKIISSINTLKKNNEQLITYKNFGVKYSLLYYTRLPLETFTSWDEIESQIKPEIDYFIVIPTHIYEEAEFNSLKTDYIQQEGSLALIYINQWTGVGKRGESKKDALTDALFA